MPQSDDARELGGLARSIDALFSRPAPIRAPESETPEPAPHETEVVAPSAPAPSSVPADEVEVTPWESPEAAGPAEIDFVLSEAHEAVGPTDTEVVGWGAPAPESEPASSTAAAFGVPAPDVAEPIPPPGDLGRAIESFLAGEPGAADEVRSLAEALRERLALDPLADAVERLVLAAGEPADPSILDLAREVIHPAVASRLVQRIGHEHDDEQKAEYTRICRRLGRVMAVAFRGALTDATDDGARRAYYDVLIAMGDVSRPIIEGMVDDENRFLVRNAVALLGEIGGKRAVELVTSALANTDSRVRREALLSLAKLGDESAGPLVLGLLEDSDAGVRSAAAVAAGELRVERSVRRLLSMLEDETDPEAQVPLLRALGKLEDPGAVLAIEKHAVRTLFSKPRADVRIAAYQALHRIGTPHARELIQAALSDKEPAVQAAVRRLVRAESGNAGR
jgi:hypothetical protein